MAKIVIVMPYFDRQYQLNKTLSTIATSKHDDFRVVIVDDNSPNDIVLPEVGFPIEIMKIKGKNWTNCAPVWNYGFNRALSFNPDIIILQSAECYHVGDILTHAECDVTAGNYLAYGCFRIDKETTYKEHDIMELSTTHNFAVGAVEGNIGECAWWNHPIYNRVPQYWCTAISAGNMIMLNGVDERFAYGYAYEDGYFQHQVENLRLEIEITDYPFVVHQWHDHIYPEKLVGKVNPNVKIYEELMKDNNYKAQHLITPDLTWSGI